MSQPAPISPTPEVGHRGVRDATLSRRRSPKAMRCVSTTPPHPDVGLVQPAEPPDDFAFFERFALPELLRATAWRTSALKAASSTTSPSWMSIARRAFPSRLELKRRAGSFRDAPLAKVSFTTFL